MVDRTNATSTTAGILRPEQLARHAAVQRVPAGPALEAYVEYHWCLRWDLPAGASYASETLPHPACTLSVELGHAREGVGEDRVVLTGVVTRRFDVTLAGCGWVLGTKFRPGGLVALAGGHARDLADRTLPARALLAEATLVPLRDLDASTPPGVGAAVVEAALAPLVPTATDADYATVLGVVADMLEDRSLVRVEEVADRHGWSRRHLERLFARYVGASPKWVLARYRMHDVVTALDAGYDGRLADLAAAYGWYDQAHFGRDFARLVGLSPAAYRDRRGAAPRPDEGTTHAPADLTG